MSEDKNRFPDILPPILPKKGLVYQVGNLSSFVCILL